MGMAYDELLKPSGQIRPEWQPVVEHLNALGLDGMNQAARLVSRLVRRSGITYQLVSGPDDPNQRPWQLDSIPWVFDREDWNQLCFGLRQRARLLNRILLDLYGPQELIQSGHLPAELLYQHPGYVRSFRYLPTKNRLMLHCYTADLARTPEGRWIVVSDRTDAPLGVGYALENRLVMSRTYPAIFRDCFVERLAPFFIQLRTMIRALIPEEQVDPRIVILTQGPGTAEYFEDVYLARYLGYMLVESGDLTVRENRLLLKTLGGLVPIDVVFRRLSDQFCDPLELQSDAGLGVAGLTSAVRAGNVQVLNSLGSSLVESNAFVPYLNSICQKMLGGPLHLESLSTLWCGDEYGKKVALEQWDRLALQGAYRVGRSTDQPSILPNSNIVDRQQWLNDHGARYVARHSLQRSVVPTWSPEGIVPMHAALRVYLVANGDDYDVMPSGLARVATDNSMLDRDVLSGHKSKEVWVCSNEPVPPVTLLTRNPRSVVELRRTGAELPSRVADNLLWLGRYVERCDGIARLLRTTFFRSVREAEPDQLPEWPGLVRQLADRGLIEPGYAVAGLRGQLPKLNDRLPTILFGEDLPDNLRAVLRQTVRLASVLKDRLSPDSWQLLFFLEHKFVIHQQTSNMEPDDAIGLLTQLIADLSAFVGLAAESMTRTVSWRILDLGRRLERAMTATDLLRQLSGSGSQEPAEWEALTEVADSAMTYRFRYHTNWSLDAVLDLLLLDDSNPRSVAFQLQSMMDHIQHMVASSHHSSSSPEKQLVTRMLKSVRETPPEALLEVESQGECSRIFELVENLHADLFKLFDLINSRYVTHSTPTRNRGR